MEISAKTRVLAVIGDPVAHSLSPVIHNAACRALGIDAVYVALRVSADSLSDVLAMQAATGGAGNVTVPHKEAVERSVMRKTDVCARVGACNTFWTEDGIRDVAVTGVQTCALPIIAAWGRTIGADVEVAAGAVEIDVAINATPVGLAGHDSLPIDVNHIPGVSKALDLVYAPKETRWVHALRERGIEAQDGREMLVQQGAAAFARFFPGNDAPVQVMRAAVNRALRV